jgi:predicted nuclease of predicted toxin-antitoxin system
MFYMDVHVPEAVTMGLRRRNIDILTSQSDGTRTFDDVALLSRATELGRVLFTQDTDLLRIAQERQQAGIAFSGVVFAHQNGVSIGQPVSARNVL